MQILVTPTFLKATKKLHPNQKKSIDKAVHAISANPQNWKSRGNRNL
jgi:mRNA-degrading endonuclease RelE of RelBE toxin-antitoxin system